MNSDLKEKVKDRIAMKIIKDTTNDIGKIEFQDGEIYCYVNVNKLKKQGGYYPCKISLSGISEYKWGKELLEMYDLYDKKINYVISNISFDTDVKIDSYFNCGLLFEKCKFKTGIDILHGNEFIFKDNEYETSNVTLNGQDIDKFYICTSSIDEVNNIKFVDEKLEVTSDFPKRIGKHVFREYDVETEIKLIAKNVEFVNTSFNNIDSMNIECNELLMRNTDITAKEMEITADKIDNDGSNMIMVEAAIIEDGNEDYNIVLDTYYDILFFNGVQLSNNMDDCVIDKDNYELQKNRLLLVDTLRTIYNNCQNVITEELLNERDKKNNKEITKVLKL